MTADAAMDDADVVPLIELDASTGRYSACEATLAWIAQHPRPFGVVACAGKYRTGKSFLLNQLTETAPGFGVGESVQACTKGLWVRRRFFRVSNELDVLYVDTEGIDALDASDDSDVRIFTLALLLSSCFLYNSVGHIDEAALSTLGLMSRVTETIRTTCEEGMQEAMTTQMPIFFWVLRDFSLRMEDKKGRALAPNEYLEDALRPPSDGGGDTARGSTRRAIVDFFPTRHLHTLPRPTKSDAGAQSINGKPWLINAKFHEGVQTLKEALYASLKPMHTRGSVALTGSMYASLCRHLAAHGDAKLPVLRDTWALMASVHARDLKDSLVAQFARELDTWSPDERRLLERRADELRRRALEAFVKDALPPVDGAARHALETALEEASARRIDAIGRNLADIVGASVGAIDALVDTTPRQAHEAVRAARAAFEEEHGAPAAAEWARAAGERAIDKWLPRVVRTMERELERGAAQHAFDASAMRSQIEASEAERHEVARAQDLRIRELGESLAAGEAAMAAEREQVERLREDLGAVRTQNATLQTALRAKQQEESAVPPPVDEGASATCIALTARLESALEATAAEQARVAELDDELRVVRAHARDTGEALAAAREREAQLTESWTAGLEAVRADAARARAAQEERLQAAQRARDAAELELRETQDRLTDERTALARAVDEREREGRQSAAALERAREAAEQAQERVVEMHRSMLDDLRQRDERQRERQDKHAQEQTEVQVRYTEAVRELEMRSNEVTGLKRRVGELEAIEVDCKRLRVDAHTVEAQRAREEAERLALLRRVEAQTKEMDALRQANLRLHNDLAVARAEKKLADARDSVGVGA